MRGMERLVAVASSVMGILVRLAFQVGGSLNLDPMSLSRIGLARL
jgi:hypothetical protein